MTAALTPDVGYADAPCQRPGCGCPRGKHRFGYARGAMRYTACLACPRSRCDEFLEELVPDASAVVPEVAEPAPAVDVPPAADPVALDDVDPVVLVDGLPLPSLPPLPPKWSAPLSMPAPAAQLVDEPAGEALPAELLLAPDAPEVLARWDAWQCPDCGSRYGQPFADHGAPTPCGGRLIPVTVTVTGRADG